MHDHQTTGPLPHRLLVHALLSVGLCLAACGGDDGGADAGGAPPSALDGGADAGGAPLAALDAATDAETEDRQPIQQGTMLELPDGWLRGSAAGGTRTFIAVPYAAPPVGPLRFQPPAPVEAWDGVLDATGPGGACIQGSRGRGSSVVSREDCLQLNVFAPDPAPARPVPVMVWLHGGGNVTGSANQPASGHLLFDGAVLRAAAAHEVVVVTINYRVGALGFLAHPALTSERGSSGNYGLMDQQAALRWVQLNILAFGGDPDQVTLFGESAGAYDVCYQAVAQGSDGLFHRAILQSGSCAVPVSTLAQGEADGEVFAASMGCSGDPAAVLSCLRAIPAEAIQPDDPPPAPGHPLLVPPEQRIPLTQGSGDPALLAVVDGTFLVEQPLDALNAGRFAHVPMIIGTNAREAALFQQGADAFTDEAQYLQGLSAVFGGDADAIAARYPVAEYETANEAAIAVGTDFAFVCPARRLAQAVSRRADVFVYNWNRGAGFPPFAGLGPAHGVELVWVWDAWTAWLGAPPDEVALADQVIGYWTSFASSGDPNADGRPSWPRYDEGTDPELVFDLQIATEAGRRKQRCNVWDELLR
jgi:para-nitrobenzyl esterase